MLLSKANQLGVIVLALRLLVKLHLRMPRIISLAARLLGVSRKAGYEAAERIEKALSEKAGCPPLRFSKSGLLKYYDREAG